MRSVVTVALLFAVFLSPTVVGQVQLIHKLNDGEKTTTVTDVTTSQTMNIAGMEIVTSADQKITTRKVNGKRGKDGRLTVRHTVDALKAEVDIAGTRLSYDSAKPDAPPPGTALDSLIDVFKGVSKSTWMVTHDATNRVQSVSGRGDFLKSLPEAVQKATARQFDSVYLTTLANDELAVIPRNPVKKGDAWNLKTTVRLDSGQTLTFVKTFTYQGTVEQNGTRLHKIEEVTNSVVYDMDANSPSPLKYLNSDLSVAESEGTTLFDAVAGRVVSASSMVHLTGAMKFEVNGQELPAEIDLRMKQVSKVRGD